MTNKSVMTFIFVNKISVSLSVLYVPHGVETGQVTGTGQGTGEGGVKSDDRYSDLISDYKTALYHFFIPLRHDSNYFFHDMFGNGANVCHCSDTTICQTAM